MQPRTKLTVQVTKAIFDDNDESTQKFNVATTVVQVFMDDIHVGDVKTEGNAQEI
jgi:hypothetical protein